MEHVLSGRRPIVAIALAALVLCGCDDRKQQQLVLQMERLKNELADMKAAAANNSVFMEDVQNKVMLLEDQVDSNRLMLTRVRVPRPELPVVRLTRNNAPPQVREEEPRRMTMDDLPDVNWGSLDGNPQLTMDNSAPSPSTEPEKKRKPFDSRPIEMYKQAFDLLQKKRHAEAVLAFERFLEQYSEHDYADNALYWLGETYYDTQDYRKALEYFGKVIRLYPEGNKVPDAILKSALSHNNVGDVASARDMMNLLLNHYPATRAAGIARKKLAELH